MEIIIFLAKLWVAGFIGALLLIGGGSLWMHYFPAKD
jgi:hypothetical protein